MAAPTAAGLTKKSEIRAGFMKTNDSELFSTDSGNLQDCVVDFIVNEIGSETKSLKNVDELLENMRDENNVLEGQVN